MILSQAFRVLFSKKVEQTVLKDVKFPNKFELVPKRSGRKIEC